MAAFTSTQSGDWNDPDTWGGGGVPTAGDSATVSTGHTVTVTENVIIGTSPVGNTVELTVSGQLTVNDGITLTARCGVTAHGTTGSNGQMTFGAGAEFIFDGTVSSVKYGFRLGTDTGTTALLKFNGTTGARCKWRSLGAGTVNGFMTSGFFNSAGLIEADYTDFFQIGDSSNRFAYPWISSTDGKALYFRNCTVDKCGILQLAVGVGAAGSLDLQNTVFTNSQNATNTLLVIGRAPSGAAVHRIDNCSFDKVVRFIPITGFTVTNNKFLGAFVATSPYVPALWQHNLVNVNATSPNSPTLVADCYYTDTNATTNARAILMQDVTGYDISGTVFDYPAATVGDFIASANTNYTLQCDHNLLLWNSAQGNAGKLVSPLNAPAAGGITVDHNTVVSSLAGTVETGVGAYGETYAGAAGMYKSLRSNLIYTASGVGAALVRTNQSTVSDILLTPDLGDYNAFNAPADSVAGNVLAVYGTSGGYTDTVATPTVAMFTSTTGLGANDIVTDPAFVDTTRCLATFDSAYLGNTATAWADATSYAVGDIVSASDAGFYGGATVNFRCINPHTSVSGNATTGKPAVAANWRTNWQLASVYRLQTSVAVYSASVKQATVQDLSTWVKGGWSPTNTALKDAGHDGETIGATAFASLGFPSVSLGIGVSVGL
jgi:hypothetical protein